MPDPEDPLSLLEQLRAKYGVDEASPLYGPCVVVPNQDLKREWTALLQANGYRMYVGEQAGKVAWIIPLKPRKASTLPTSKPFINGLSVDSQPAFNNPAGSKDPRSNEASTPTPTPKINQNYFPGKGCITGRAWTSAEDKQILIMLDRGKGVMEIARELAPKLNRSEEAIKTRLLRLKHRQGVGSEPTPTREKPVESPTQKKILPASTSKHQELRSLLESALYLSQDIRHRDALKLILETCLRLAAPNQEK